MIENDLTYTKAGGKNKVSRTAWVRAKGKIEKLKKQLERVRANLETKLRHYESRCIRLELRNIDLVLSNAVAAQNQHSRSLEHTKSSIEQQSEHLAILSNIQETLRHDIMVNSNLSGSSAQKALLPPPVASLKQERNDKPLTGAAPKTIASDDSRDLVAVAEQSTHIACRQNCMCVCHSQRGFETPSVIRNIVGRLFVGYVGVPSLTPACSENDCTRLLRPKWHVQYYFPQWWIKQKILPHVAMIATIRPPKLVLEVPRVIDPGSIVFDYALSGNIKGLQKLFSSGAASPLDINGNNGRTLLHGPSDSIWDLIFTSPERKRLGHGFDDEVPSERRFTNLHLTVLQLRGNDLALELGILMRSSQSIDSLDSQARTPLFWAVHRGDFNAVSLLLAYGANPNLADCRGVTPLRLAATLEDTHSLSELLQYNPDIAAVEIQGRTAVHYACEYQDPKNKSTAPTLHILHSHGGTLLNTNKYGRTALHKSAAADNVGALELLLEHGSAAINQRDDFGETPLVDAIAKNNHNAIRTLWHHGPEYSSRYGRSSDLTVLHLLARDADLETLHLLNGIRGLDIWAKTHDGTTAPEIFNARGGEASRELRDAWDLLLVLAEDTGAVDSEKQAVYEDALDELGS